MFDPAFMIVEAAKHVALVLLAMAFFVSGMVLLYCICLALIRGDNYDRSSRDEFELPPKAREVYDRLEAQKRVGERVH